MGYGGYRSNLLASVLHNAEELDVEIQRMFLAAPRYASTMRSNPNLHPDLLKAELAKKLSAGDMMTLVSHQLDREMVRLVLSKERRVTVLKRMVSYNPPRTKAEAEDLVTLSHPEHREFLMGAYRLVRGRRELAKIIGPHLFGAALMGFLIDTDNADVNLAPQAISKFLAKEKNTKYSVFELRRFFDVRGDAIKVCLPGAGRRVREAIAGSINLKESDQLGLLGLTSATARRLTAGTYSINAESSLIYALVRNMVVTPRVLDILANAKNVTPETTRAINKRKRLGLSVIEPGFKNITDDAAMEVLTYMSVPGIFSKKPNQMMATYYFHGAWLVRLAEEVGAEPAKKILKVLGDDTVGGYLWILGAQRIDAIAAKLHKTVGVKRPKGVATHAYNSQIRARGQLSGAYYFKRVEEAQDKGVLKEMALEADVSQWSINEGVAKAAGQILHEAFKGDVGKWELLAQLIDNAGNSPLKDLVGVVNRLSR